MTAPSALPSTPFAVLEDDLGISAQIRVGTVTSVSSILSFSVLIEDDGRAVVAVACSSDDDEENYGDDGISTGVILLDEQGYRHMKDVIAKLDAALAQLRASGRMRRFGL